MDDETSIVPVGIVVFNGPLWGTFGEDGDVVSLSHGRDVEFNPFVVDHQRLGPDYRTRLPVGAPEGVNAHIGAILSRIA